MNMYMYKYIYIYITFCVCARGVRANHNERVLRAGEPRAEADVGREVCEAPHLPRVLH